MAHCWGCAGPAKGGKVRRATAPDFGLHILSGAERTHIALVLRRLYQESQMRGLDKEVFIGLRTPSCDTGFNTLSRPQEMCKHILEAWKKQWSTVSEV